MKSSTFSQNAQLLDQIIYFVLYYVTENDLCYTSFNGYHYGVGCYCIQLGNTYGLEPIYLCISIPLTSTNVCFEFPRCVPALLCPKNLVYWSAFMPLLLCQSHMISVRSL